MSLVRWTCFHNCVINWLGFLQVIVKNLASYVVEIYFVPLLKSSVWISRVFALKANLDPEGGEFLYAVFC